MKSLVIAYSVPKKIEPVDGRTLIERAVAFANARDVSNIAEVCSKARVLPPRARYWINTRGVVFSAPRPRPNAELVGRVHFALRSAFDRISHGKVPRLDDSAAYTWHQIRHFDPHEVPNQRKARLALASDDEEFIIPTLDALVAAATVLLYENMGRLKRCANAKCARFFIRWTEKDKVGRSRLVPKGPTCGRIECKEIRREEKAADRGKKEYDEVRRARALTVKKAAHISRPKNRAP